MKYLALTLCPLLLLIGSSVLRAGIVWEKTEAEVTPEENAARVEVPFFFKVASDGQAVQILETGSSCGCTVPALDKRIYAPGEEGMLMVEFTAAGKQGRQRNRITLRVLEAGREARETLTLTVNLPFWAKPDASRLEWSANDTGAKSLRIVVLSGVSLKLRPLNSAVGKHFLTSLDKTDDDTIYTFEASPLNDPPKGLLPVFVDVISKDERVATLTIFLKSR